MPASPGTLELDSAEEILGDLYQYRPKSALLAWVLWATLGFVGVHRFYLERPATGLLMLFTGGGALAWWLADAFRLGPMLRAHAEEQERRRATGLSPVELAFMPPLASVDLSRPPEWVTRWRTTSARRRTRRLMGDVLVLLVCSFTLAVVATRLDVWEALGAVFVLIAGMSAGAALGRWGHVPVFRALSRWIQRLRLFYYFTPEVRRLCSCDPSPRPSPRLSGAATVPRSACSPALPRLLGALVAITAIGGLLAL